MKYLSNYKIFLEEKEETKTTDQTTKEPNDDLESGIKPPSYYEGENKKPEETGPTETGNTNKSGGEKNSSKKSSTENSSEETNTENTLSELSETIKLITTRIENAYNEKNSQYFFRPYAVNSWRTFVTATLVRDDEEKAVKSFFGEDIKDQSSWWWGNVTSELSKHISFTKDGKKISLIEALKKGQYLNTIRPSVLDGIKDEKQKENVRAGFQLLEWVYPKLKEKTLNKDNVFFWDYVVDDTYYEISVDPDYSVGTYTSNNEYKSESKEAWMKKINNIKLLIPDTKPGEVFNRIWEITKIIAGGFTEKSVPIWKTWRNWYGDDESQAIAWFKKMIEKPIISDILDPLKSKIEREFKYENPKQKEYYLKQIDRIKNELFPNVIKGMEGDQLWDTVEFTIYRFDRKSRVYVEIDTDI